MNPHTLVLIFGYFAALQTTVDAAQIHSFPCVSEGRFADPSDCGTFIECVTNGMGDLVPFTRSCYGRAFDPETSTCVETSKVKGCHVRRSRHFLYSTSRFDSLCKDTTTKYACGDCGTQVTCISGRAFEVSCESNMRCNDNIPNFNGGVCHVRHGDKCSCNEPNSYHKDPYSEQGFFFCQGIGSIPKYYNCPSEMTFDENMTMCLNQYGAPACTRKGIFPYPNTCSKYYMCTYALEGWLQTELECEPKQLFNEYTRVCEDPCDWPIKEFSCKAQGRFGNPQKCREFYECIDTGLGSFIQMNRSCPLSFHWNEEAGNCISEHDSSCREKKEGPIVQCRLEYEQLCTSTVQKNTTNPLINEDEDEERRYTTQNTIEGETTTSQKGLSDKSTSPTTTNSPQYTEEELTVTTKNSEEAGSFFAPTIFPGTTIQETTYIDPTTDLNKVILRSKSKNPSVTKVEEKHRAESVLSTMINLRPDRRSRAPLIFPGVTQDEKTL